MSKYLSFSTRDSRHILPKDDKKNYKYSDRLATKVGRQKSKVTKRKIITYQCIFPNEDLFSLTWFKNDITFFTSF